MVPVICIDDTEKPPCIKKENWIVKNQEYTLIFVSFHPNQGNIQGCLLSEVEINENDEGFEYYKLARFGVKPENLEALYQLAKDCTTLNDFSLEELLEETKIEVLEEN